MFSPKTNEQVDMARFIREDIEGFMHASPLNLIPGSDGFLFDEPLVRYADGNDPLFYEYKTIIAPTHLTPREAMAEAFNKSPEDIPAQLSIISWVLPISEKIRESNRGRRRTPSRLWVYTRWYGEKFNDALRKHVVKLLTDRGHLATAPALQSSFEIVVSDEAGIFSTWSEKHIAYTSGHGTFSLGGGLITERGIAHRCGSVVTDLILLPSPRAAKNLRANCLFYDNGKCRACVARCPSGAISEKGHDKMKCREYQSSKTFHRLLEKYDVGFVRGCGMCQTKVPCEFRNPVKN